ncbi:hypothetical protein TNCV_2920601 [Trichonephila clavipes]|nr:hypothetical protein TNCV_2920601 [Trichonephila clavipes]
MRRFPPTSAVRLLINILLGCTKRTSGKNQKKRPGLGSDEWLLHQDNAPALKSCLMEIHLPSVEDAQAETENFLKSLLKTFFQNCYQKWYYRMQKCVNAEGNYFGGDIATKN